MKTLKNKLKDNKLNLLLKVSFWQIKIFFHIKIHLVKINIFYLARVTKLIKEVDSVIGVEYEKDGKTFKEFGPVIIATGGYAADFS